MDGPTTWFEQLPTCYLATGMRLRDPQGHVLLVKTHYRPDWRGRRTRSAAPTERV